MAPRVQYSRDRLIDAAVELTREKGFEAVTARKLGAQLGSSSRPIFTAFENMEELQDEVVARAKLIFSNCIKDCMNETRSFKKMGLRWIRFAQEEPQLYRLIFMREGQGNPFRLKDIAQNFDDIFDEVLKVIEDKYQINREEAEHVYRHMIFHAHGIASLIVAGETSFTDDELVDIFSEALWGIVGYIRQKRQLKEDQV